MAEHVEFPLLTPAAKCVLVFAEGNRCHANSPILERRRLIADGIRGAMSQIGTWTYNSEFPKIIDAAQLEAIANNLHSPPPLPPTPEELDQALATVLQQVECQEGSPLAKQVAILRAGVAYHCKG